LSALRSRHQFQLDLLPRPVANVISTSRLNLSHLPRIRSDTRDCEMQGALTAWVCKQIKGASSNFSPHGGCIRHYSHYAYQVPQHHTCPFSCCLPKHQNGTIVAPACLVRHAIPKEKRALRRVSVRPITLNP
jgi:hypothetical protein